MTKIGSIVHQALQGSVINSDEVDQQTIDSFGDRIDPAFKAILSKISRMPAVLDRIEKKQDAQLAMLEIIKTKYAEGVDNKLDDIAKTLDGILGEKRKDREDQEKKDREDALEQPDVPELVSNDANDKKEAWGFSPNMWAAILAGGYVLTQIGHMQPQIAGLLALLKSSSILGAGGVVGQFLGGASNAGKFSGALGSISEEAGGVAKSVSMFSNATSAIAQKLAGITSWMKWLARVCRVVLVLDPLIALLSIQRTEEDYRRELSKAFGRCIGGVFGAEILGFLGGVLGGMLGGPLGAFTALAGFVVGAVWGVMIGEGIGLALYKLFASNGQDWSGFYDLVVKVGKDMYKTGEIVVKGVGELASKAVKAAEDFVFGPEAKADVVEGGSPSGKYTGKTAKPQFMPGSGNGSQPSEYVPGGPDNPTSRDRSDWKGKYDNTPSMFKDQRYPNKGYTPTDSDPTKDSEHNYDPKSWRANNPGNIFGNEGTAKRRGGLKGVHQRAIRYATAEEGFCELARLLTEYVKRGLNTIEKIFYEYAPPSENDTESYIQDVAKKLGISRSQVINLDTDAQLFYMMRAISSYEGGVSKRSGVSSEEYWSDEVISAGIKLFRKKYGKQFSDDPNSPGVSKPEMGSTSSMYGQAKGGGGAGGGPGGGSNGFGGGDGGVPSYGKSGSVVYGNDGSYFDKGFGTNHQSLDILVSMCYSAGLIPPNSAISFNDKHHGGPKNSVTHGQGIAVDISQGGGSKTSRDKLINFLLSIGEDYGVRVKAEDHTGRGNSTGQHVHAGFYTKEDADKFYQVWLQRNQGPSAKVSKTQSPASPVSRTPAMGTKLISFGSGASDAGTTIINNNTTQVAAPSGGGPQNKSGKQSLGVASWKASAGDLLYKHL